VAILRFVRDIPIEATHPTRAVAERIEAGLPALRGHPMLIVWGARDFCFTVTDALAGWRSRFPAAEVRVVEDAGHYVVEDAHERIGPWVAEFLARGG
jgi:haloalkane dehalogenase